MKNKELLKIIYCALLTALIIIGTIIIRIPIPGGSGGYVNFGDLFIFLGASMFGPLIGAIAGGVGSAMADILSGGAHWAGFSLIIKALMGFAVGKFAYNKKFHSTRNLIGVIFAIIILVIGYYIAESIIMGNIYIGLTAIPYNIVQGVISAIIYFIIGRKISKIQLIKGE